MWSDSDETDTDTCTHEDDSSDTTQDGEQAANEATTAAAANGTALQLLSEAAASCAEVLLEALPLEELVEG